MMKKALPILIVVVVIAAGLVWYFMGKSGANNTNNTNATNRSLSLTMAEQNGSGQSGTVNIYEQDDQTKVEVILRNYPTGTAQPAHIHTGTCAAIGGVKYPLTSLVNGESTTTLDVSYDDLLAELPLAINVHKSAAESGVYVACTDITDGTTTNDNGMNDQTYPANSPLNNVLDTPLIQDSLVPAAELKVFNITGRMFAFSESEIRVKKGDTVTINFSSTGGLHDWVIDEFNARTKQVNAGGSTSVTFTADKAGTFEYYCSVGNHRAMGMVGKLIVE